MPEESGLGEQALNKMAELALASQMEEAENLQVQVKIDPSHLAKGEVDSLTILGEGLVMQPDMRMSELEMQINTIAVRPLKALFGKIEMVKPTDGTARVVLTQEDLNLAFNAPATTDHLRQMVVQINGKLVKINTIHVACNLLSDGKISLQAVVSDNDISWQTSFTSTPKVSNDGQGIVIEDIQYQEGKEASPELTNALVERMHEILNLRNFEMEGISLRIQQLQIEADKLTLQAEALVTQFPAS